MIYNCANWADLPWTEVRPGVRRKAFTGEGATFAMNELQPHHEPRRHAGDPSQSDALCRGGGR